MFRFKIDKVDILQGPEIQTELLFSRENLHEFEAEYRKVIIYNLEILEAIHPDSIKTPVKIDKLDNSLRFFAHIFKQANYPAFKCCMVTFLNNLRNSSVFRFDTQHNPNTIRQKIDGCKNKYKAYHSKTSGIHISEL